MSRLTVFFAKRYLFSKKSHALINVISVVSSFAVAIPVAALIVLLSIFNGISSLMEQLNSKFDAELRISPVEGKFFEKDSSFDRLVAVEGVDTISYYLEDNALARYNGAQTIVTVRGVDDSYPRIVPIKEMITRGEYSTGYRDIAQASVGMGVAYSLGVNVNSSIKLDLFVPASSSNSFLPTPSFRELSLFPTSIFVLDAETDQKYIITSLSFAQKLFKQSNGFSAAGVKLVEGADLSKVIRDISRIVGDKYLVESRYEQNQSVYRIVENEKRAVFFISILVVIIASFSLVGSLIMLITDKKQQISTLKVLGAKDLFINRVFFLQGLYITLIGVAVGLVVGVVITLAQQYWGIISINSETLIINSYPVILRISDVVAVLAVVLTVNLFIIYITAKVTLQRDGAGVVGE